MTSRFCPSQKINASKTRGSGEALAAGAGAAVRMALAEHLQAVGFWHVPKIPLPSEEMPKCFNESGPKTFQENPTKA